MTNGVETQMVIYPNEGHGIRQPKHREDVLRRTLAWFKEHDVKPEKGNLTDAVTLYLSFDKEVKADRGGGELTFSTRSGAPGKGPYKFEKGFDDKVFTIAKDKGISGGALEVKDVVPDNGRIFVPAKGNIGFKKGGWSGAVSYWMNTDPNTSLRTKFCDPVQITQKGANNGGIWVDFNDRKPPRNMRMGVFPAVPEGKVGIKEEDPNAPLIVTTTEGIKAGDWHHIVMTWENLDTGKANAHAILYVDGKKVGELKDREIAMDWDMDKAGIYIGVNYIGLLDEFAVFNRALTTEEVEMLHKRPALLTGSKRP